MIEVAVADQGQIELHLLLLSGVRLLMSPYCTHSAVPLPTAQ